ncbi:hypothetical protein WN943_006975 [Citrus x changshan-huyou]
MKKRLRMVSRGQVDDKYSFLYIWLVDFYGIDLFFFFNFQLVAALEEEQADQIDLSCFSGNLRHDDRDNARDCWKLSDGNNFRVRSKHFCYDKTKVPPYFVCLLWYLYILHRLGRQVMM